MLDKTQVLQTTFSSRFIGQARNQIVHGARRFFQNEWVGEGRSPGALNWRSLSAPGPDVLTAESRGQRPERWGGQAGPAGSEGKGSAGLQIQFS